MTTHDIHPAEPGAYWARYKDTEDYVLIVFVSGVIPFFSITHAMRLTDGEKGSINLDDINIGPRVERPYIDEPVAAESEGRAEHESE